MAKGNICRVADARIKQRNFAHPCNVCPVATSSQPGPDLCLPRSCRSLIQSRLPEIGVRLRWRTRTSRASACATTNPEQAATARGIPWFDACDYRNEPRYTDWIWHPQCIRAQHTPRPYRKHSRANYDAGRSRTTAPFSYIQTPAIPFG